MSIQFRLITADDNPAVEKLVREVLTEFGANKPGFAWADPELKAMHQTYTRPGSCYYVIEQDDQLLGGGGIGPFIAEASSAKLEGVCELQKMYLHKQARGQGLGNQLINKLLRDAKSLGYKRCYLETLESMTAAQKLYQQQGFARLSAPITPSVHHGCDCWMIREL